MNRLGKSYSTLLFVATAASLLMLCISYSFITSQINSNYKSLAARSVTAAVRMQYRRRFIENYCKTIEDNKPNIKKVVRKMFIDKQHRFSWCPVFKAGSSIWMEAFAKLAGALDAKTRNLLDKNILQLNTVARQNYPFNDDVNRSLTIINSTKRFFIARHPFERILSAYRDKLEHREGREFYYRRYGMRIARVYRQKWYQNQEPTFPEFLAFLLSEKYFDEHWSPIIKECEPCHIKYHYIIKMETFLEDNIYMLNDLKLLNLVQLDFKQHINPSGKTNMGLAKLYYSQVPKELLRKVYDLYKHDFKMFEYSPEAYFEFAK